MRLISKQALNGLCGLITLDFIGIFGLIIVSPEEAIFNSVMTGFTWTLCGLITIGGSIMAYETCCVKKRNDVLYQIPQRPAKPPAISVPISDDLLIEPLEEPVPPSPINVDSLEFRVLLKK